MQPWLSVYFFDIGHPSFDQLTPVKTRYPLTSIAWPYHGLKFTAHRGKVFFWSWPLTKCWFSIGSRAHVWLTWWKQGRSVRKLANANPGLEVNRIITFSSIQMFLLLCFAYMVIIETQSRRPNDIQKTSAQSFKTQIKILLFSGLA